MSPYKSTSFFSEILTFSHLYFLIFVNVIFHATKLQSFKVEYSCPRFELSIFAFILKNSDR